MHFNDGHDQAIQVQNHWSSRLVLVLIAAGVIRFVIWGVLGWLWLRRRTCMKNNLLDLVQFLCDCLDFISRSQSVLAWSWEIGYMCWVFAVFGMILSHWFMLIQSRLLGPVFVLSFGCLFVLHIVFCKGPGRSAHFCLIEFGLFLIWKAKQACLLDSLVTRFMIRCWSCLY